MQFLRPVFVSLLLVLTVNQSIAQSPEAGEDYELLAWYDSLFGIDNTELQTGLVYRGLRKASVSHPFHRTEGWTEGSVNYRGQEYSNIELLYDINEDKLVVRGIGEFIDVLSFIELKKDEITRFSMADDNFVFIPDSVQGFNQGFYQMVYNGEGLKILARRTKEIVIDPGEEPEYKVRDTYYAFYKEEYSTLITRSSFFKIDKTLKKQLKSYARQNKLRILKPGTDSQLIDLCKHFESLIDG